MNDLTNLFIYYLVCTCIYLIAALLFIGLKYGGKVEKQVETTINDTK